MVLRIDKGPTNPTVCLFLPLSYLQVRHVLTYYSMVSCKCGQKYRVFNSVIIFCYLKCPTHLVSWHFLIKSHHKFPLFSINNRHPLVQMRSPSTQNYCVLPLLTSLTNSLSSGCCSNLCHINSSYFSLTWLLWQQTWFCNLRHQRLLALLGFYSNTQSKLIMEVLPSCLHGG